MARIAIIQGVHDRGERIRAFIRPAHEWTK